MSEKFAQLSGIKNRKNKNYNKNNSFKHGLNETLANWAMAVVSLISGSPNFIYDFHKSDI